MRLVWFFCFFSLFVCLWVFYEMVRGFAGAYYQIQLLFYSTEKLTFQNAPSPQEFNEGDDAVIVCDVISSPPPTIIWKYQRTKIQPEKDGKRSSLYFIHIFIIVALNHHQHILSPHSLMQTPRQIAAFTKAVMFLP